MEEKRDYSVPPPLLGQGLAKSIWSNDATGVPLPLLPPSGGSPHSPNGVRTPGGIPFPPPGIPPVRNTIMTPAPRHAGGDYRLSSDEEFKRHTVAMLMQRETDMHFLIGKMREMHQRLEVLTHELVKTKAQVFEEKRLREEIMNAMLTKEMHENMERARREGEEAMKREEQAWRKTEELKVMQESIAALEVNQEALKEQLERMNYADLSMRSLEIPRALTPKEILGNVKKEEEEKKDKESKKEEGEKKGDEDKKEDVGERKEEEKTWAARAKSDGSPTSRSWISRPVKTPRSGESHSSGSQSWATRKPRSIVRTCFNCHKEGHYAKDCHDMEVLCETCGGEGHAAGNCPSNRKCFNCNKMGHRSWQCSVEGARRCFHCRRVGHLAIHCKFAPKE